jgi:hypothetical protein
MKRGIQCVSLFNLQVGNDNTRGTGKPETASHCCLRPACISSIDTNWWSCVRGKATIRILAAVFIPVRDKSSD